MLFVLLKIKSRKKTLRLFLSYSLDFCKSMFTKICILPIISAYLRDAH